MRIHMCVGLHSTAVQDITRLDINQGVQMYCKITLRNLTEFATESTAIKFCTTQLKGGGGGMGRRNKDIRDFL